MAVNPHAEHLQELLEDLNEPQREAVTHGEGPLLILAGAGSGKTRVLAHRIAFLIYTDQAQAGEILAITFTNKAAGEMRERVQRLLGHGTRGMWVMTFHAACARILRAEAQRLGYTRQFTIYDQADARRLAKRSADAVGVDSKRYTPAAVQNQISAAKNRLLDAAAYRQAVGSQFEEMIADVYDIYERDLHRMNAMDFDDLLFRTVNLLELYEEVRERYGETFRHVLVDEYQDTNHAQYRMLQLLVGGGPPPRRGAREPDERPTYAGPVGHRNLAVVGDDSQSIYSFRGADIRNILDFQEDFPDARVVKLEQNYRSTQTILSAANAVIANNRGGIAKRLWSDLGEGEPIRVRELEDDFAEARFVVGEIQRLLDEEQVARAEIAVLYRTNALSRVLEETLTRNEIAYQVIGGTKFYERAEIKDAIAYLSLLANPADAVSFARVVNSPRRGIGQTSLARVLAHADAQGLTVWEAASAPEQVPGLGAAAVKALRRFMDTMADLRAMAGMPAIGQASAGARAQGADAQAHGELAQPPGADAPSQDPDAQSQGERAAGGVPVGDLLEALLSQTGYVEALEAERTIESQGRIENLEQLVEGAREFDARTPEGEDTLDAYLQEVALVADADSRSDEGLVTLMTLHNAKGLEYPVVFIAGCEDGVFPHSRAVEEGALEEERRLFYVGITRAMRLLYLSYARRRAVFGAQTYGMRSRFLDEMPADLLDEPHQALFRAASWSASAGAVGGRAATVGRGAPLRTGAQRAAAGSWLAPGGHEREDAAASAQFRLGEDVVHAAFGDGVVTGVEPGGVIVVRFAGDGSERKLMAEYAPVSRR
ncbi:MAG TPA: UvrD-helicase domain-containing protein [Solirubrobacteraceae bacterium]|nr:UvrD-helicase domain-containing protein [Solirubrobacteraceae bacterium]